MRRDYSGSRFGRWTVAAISPHWHRDNQLWSCTCDCGSVRDVAIGSLRGSRSKSCGCLVSEVNGTHRMSRTRTYNSWATMIQRCTNPTNPNYINYGGRGIMVCDQWLTFASFFADMGERPTGRTLDRRDNDLGYSPENCRWATPSEQNNNCRTRARAALDRLAAHAA